MKWIYVENVRENCIENTIREYGDKYWSYGKNEELLYKKCERRLKGKIDNI